MESAITLHDLVEIKIHVLSLRFEIHNPLNSVFEVMGRAVEFLLDLLSFSFDVD
jgi:hypothetical protein